MDHPLGVRVSQPFADLTGDSERFLDLQLALSIKALAQGLAFHQRHDVVEDPLDLARVVNRQDMRMLQAAL
jgi:hypothetical protein